MYNTKMFTQAIEYQKALFDNSFAAVSTLQDHGQRMMNQAFEKSPILPDDGKKMVSSWIGFAKQNRENCKEYVDTSFDKIKDFFAESGPVSSVEKPPAKTSKKSE